MGRISSVLLEFDATLNRLGNKKELRDGLSVVVQVGDTLWVTNDETISLERLSHQAGSAGDNLRYEKHAQFALHDYLELPVPPASDPEDSEEADLEGLDYDHERGYLWLVGSHSRKRDKIGTKDAHKPVQESFQKLGTVSADGNRFLLARIPIVKRDGTYTLDRNVDGDGDKRWAARLHGDAHGNDLTAAVADDEHLGRFLEIPGKDNGFDIEGLAVVGRRILLGLRGPVLRGWAGLLEVEPEEDEDDPSRLRLKRIGQDGQRYQKHFLQLDGLGVRDLCVDGQDLLILAGPTMEIDGPVTVVRWRGGAQVEKEQLVFAEQLPVVLEVPYGTGEQRGKDHAEGMTLVSQDDGDARTLLVVYDAAADSRKQEPTSVEADLFALPKRRG